MTHSPDAVPDQSFIEDDVQLTAESATTPGDAETASLGETVQVVGTGGEKAVGELADSPRDTDSRSGGYKGREDNEPTHADDGADLSEADDASGEPPDFGDTHTEQGGEDPEAMRRALELRAVIRSTEIMQALPVDPEHVPAIADAHVNLALAIGAKRDPETGNNAFDPHVLAQARAEITGLSDRMTAQQATTMEWRADLQNAEDLDEDTQAELMDQAHRYRDARQEVDSRALTRILTAETIAGNPIADGLLTNRVRDERDAIEAKKSLDPHYIVRPRGNRLDEQRFDDFADVWQITKTAEELGEPVPHQVLEPDDYQIRQDFEIELLLLEHDNRLARPANESGLRDFAAHDRVQDVISEIVASLREDNGWPATSQLIATFPRLHEITWRSSTKHELAQQYLNHVGTDIGDMPMDVATYADVVNAGCTVFDDPSLFNDPEESAQIVSRFNTLINDAAARLILEVEEYADDPLARSRILRDVTRNGAEWHARMFALGSHDELPSETIGRLNSQRDFTNLYQRNIDELNLIYARELTKVGSTQAARLLIEMFTHDVDSVADALTECLQVATAPDPIFGEYHPERVEALRPNDAMVREIPDLGRIYNAAHAITHEDMDVLRGTALALVRTIDSPDSTAEIMEVKFSWIQALLQRVDTLDRPTGFALRRELLPQLQGTDAASMFTPEVLLIYRDLIRNGTVEDYQAIDAAVSNIEVREHAANDMGLGIWAPLARLLARTPIQQM